MLTTNGNSASPSRSCSEPQRVSHIVPALFDSADGIIGGAERYALELARHMASETPTTLISFGERDREERLGQLNIRVLGNPWLVRGQRSNPFTMSLIRELQNADVVHCHQQHVLASSLAAFVCRLTGRKVFVSDLGGGGWDISGYVSTDRWYHGHLHISEYSRKICKQVDKAWSRVILGGVDTEKFSPDELIRRDGTVLFVGRLLPHKGVNDLIEAVSPHMPLEIIGHGFSSRYLSDLKALAKGKRVKFRHECDDEALVDAYRRAMCLVLPSVFRDMYGKETTVPELLGQTLLEAMACGTPVICTDVASMPEVVEDGVTGFIVPPHAPRKLEDKLLWLRDHPRDTAQMGKSARQRVLDKFTWPAVVRRCLDAYGASRNGH